MKVRNKLILSFSLIIVVLAFITFYVGYNFKNLLNQFDAVNEGIIPDTNLLIEVETVAGDTYLEMMDYVLNENESSKERAFLLLAYLESIEATKRPQGNYTSQDEYIWNIDFVSAIAQFRFATQNMIYTMEQDGESTDLLEYGRHTSLLSLRNLQNVISRQKANYSEELAAAVVNFHRGYKSALNSMLLSMGIITLVALIAGYFTIKSILKPLYDLRKGTEMIAQGNLSYKVGTKARDEIGELSRAFDRMTQSLSNTMTSVTNLNQEIAERKQAERNLKEEKNRSDNYLNITDTMLVALDMDGRVTMINKKGCEILEYEKNEILGKNWFDTFIPAHIREEVREIHKAITSGEIEPYQKVEGYTIRTKAGKVKHVIWHNSIVKDEHDRITGTLSSGEDVTERKESEERFRLLADNSTDLISLIRVIPGLKTEYVSPSCLRITGFTQEDFYNDPELGLEMIHPDDREAFTSHVNYSDSDGDKPVAFRIIRKDGRIIRIEQTHKHIYNDNGEIVAMHLIAHDVTERVEAEEALKESEEKYRSVVANINSGIIVVQDGQTVFYNPAVYKMLGYSEREYSKIDYKTTIHPDDVYLINRRIMERLDDVSSADSLITRALTKSGDIKWLETRSVKITWNDRPAVQAFIIDITDRFKAEEALKESEEKFSKSFHASPSTIAITTLHEGEYIEVSDSYTQATGYTHEELIGRTTQDIDLWVNLEERVRMFNVLKEKGEIRNEEFDFRMKSGEIRTWLFSADEINIGGKECLISVANDITGRKRRDQLRDAENHVLTLLGQGAELKELLEAIVVMGEFNNSNIKGSILLYEPAKNLLIPFASPNLPAAYNAALAEGVPVGPEKGTCGTAAYRRERVAVPDIADSPSFPEGAAKLAVENGLLACWSQPIISSEGILLGTIANYCSKVGEPGEADLTVLEWSARIAAIAIERKQSLDALIESREFSSSLLENSPNQVMVINPDTSIEYVNPSWEELNGWTLDEVKGIKAPYPWWPEDMRESFMEVFPETFKSETGGGGELAAQKKTGELYWLDMKWVPVRRNGKLRNVLVTSIDITEKKQAEDALRESEERFRDLFDNASEMIQSVDLDGNFIFVNKAWMNALGYNEKEIQKLNIWNIIHPDHVARCKKDFAVILSGKSTSVSETVFISKTGQPITVEGGATAQMKDDVVVATRGIFRDITERKRMEEEIKAHRDHLEELVRERTAELTVVNSQLNDELSERKKIEQELRQAKNAADVANTAKSEFLARMSHEIRTPIHGIMGTLDLVSEGTLGREQHQYLDMAKSSADSLLNVINDVLDFSKIEAGKLEIEDVDFYLPRVLDEIIESMAVSAFRKGLELTCHIAKEIPKTLVGDSGRLRQIIINLVGNAIKFTGHGEIALTATLEKETKKNVVICFTVRDTGIGISEEKQDMIFETFQQANGSVNRQYGGTGLGLTICRQLVTRMGGRIWVESTPGQGSSFNFTLKFTKQSRKPKKELIPSSIMEVKDIRLLVVDDNTTNRQLLTEILESWGFLVTGLDNGPAAVQELLHAEKINDNYRLILLDKNMPTVDGFAVAKKIQQECAQKPDIIMMLSPNNVSNELSRCQELGIGIHVVKPVRKPTLFEAVLTALGMSQTEQDEIIQVVPSNASGIHLRILVAEDNPTAQLIARKTLEKMGHTVTIAGNGLEEIRLFEEGEYDLILTDVEMPILDGFEATKRIKQIQKDRGQNIPVIAMTAYAMKEDRDRCLAAGMDSYLAKPVKPDELHAILDELFPREETSAEIPAVALDTGSSNQAVDMEAAMKVFGDDTELLKEASELFMNEDYPEQLKLLKDGIKRRDADVVRAAAHSIKGAARTLGGMALGEVAFRLEQMGRDNELADAEEQLKEMEKEYKLFADFFLAMSS